MWILNTCVSVFANETGPLILYFIKLNLRIKKKNKKNLKSIVNIFVFFIKISCQSKESPLSRESPPLVHPTLSRKNILSPPLLPN